MITLKSVFLTTGGNNFHYHQIGNVLESNSSIRQFFFLVLIAENKIKKIQLFFQNTLHSSGNLDGRARCRHCQNKINVEKNKRWIKRVKKKICQDTLISNGAFLRSFSIRNTKNPSFKP